MESVVNGTVLGVSSKPLKNGSTLYQVNFSDGNTYATFKPDIAQKAANHQNQQVSALVKVEQNGQYTNFYINDVGPQGSIAAPTGGAQPITGGQIIGQGTAPQAQPQQGQIVPQQASSGGRGFTEEDKARVSRFAAQGTAWQFIGSIYAGAGPEALGEAVKNARALTEELLRHGYTGQFVPSQQVAATPETAPIVPTATTPQEVAAQVAGVQVGVSGVQEASASDIPWD